MAVQTYSSAGYRVEGRCMPIRARVTGPRGGVGAGGEAAPELGLEGAAEEGDEAASEPCLEGAADGVGGSASERGLEDDDGEVEEAPELELEGGVDAAGAGARRRRVASAVVGVESTCAGANGKQHSSK